jgi:hypothetical protein
VETCLADLDEAQLTGVEGTGAWVAQAKADRKAAVAELHALHADIDALRGRIHATLGM